MWWIVLQWSIALVIAAAFPADPTFALLRGVLVALGGTLQLVFASGLWTLLCWQCDVPAPRNENNRPLSFELVRLALRETLEPDTARFRYAAALAVTVGLAAAAYRVANFSNGYWIAMTILIVLRSELRDTVRITVTRIIGTMVGAGVATLVVALLRPSQTILVAVIAVTAWGCYACLRVNYALFSMLVTGYIALLFAFGGLPEPPWHCIVSSPLRSRAVSRSLRTFFTSPVLDAPRPVRRACQLIEARQTKKEPEIDSCQGSCRARHR